MDFFTNITPPHLAGLILLIAGALVTFLSGKITAKMEQKNANMIVKYCGVGIVVVGFILIMFV